MSTFRIVDSSQMPPGALLIWSDLFCSPEQDLSLGLKKPSLNLRAIISDLDHHGRKNMFIILTYNSGIQDLDIMT